LVSGQRINTDYITFGFAPPPPPQEKEGHGFLKRKDLRGAARGSQSFVIQQILQILLNNSQQPPQ
jgi:hypothetical protein